MLPPRMKRPSLVFTLPEYRGMQETLCAAGHEPGELKVAHFPDGERYLQILTRSTAARSCWSAAPRRTPRR
jgi:hypothetical protein